MGGILITSIEQGMIFALLAVGVIITFKLLDLADLSVEGTFPLGAFLFAWSMKMELNPIIGIILAFIGGCLAGGLTYFFYKKIHIPAILSGILTMTILYTVNLKITGSSNVPIVNVETVFTLFESVPKMVVLLFFVLLMKFSLDWFLQTEKGYLLKVTGDNEILVKSLGQDPKRFIMLGLVLGNGLAALSGAFMAQYQGFVDITMGQSMIVTALASIVIGDAVMRDSSVLKITTRGILGAIVYRIIYGLAIHFGLNPDDLKAITALIVVVFIGYNNFRSYNLKNRQIKKVKESRDAIHS